jgi:hypothetical protein
MTNALASRALALACAAAASVALGAVACTATQDDIHQSDQAKSMACVGCHFTAYEAVQTPLHVGVLPTTCGDCHGTSAWVPTIDQHPEAKFPIRTGAHANKAIGCNDCHIPSLGSDIGGRNTDCVHCHIGAHDAPAIDATHAGVANYPGSMPTSPPTCLGCHPSG